MTGYNSNIDEVIERFKAKADLAKFTDPSEALLIGVNAAKGQMQYRIFNEAKDADGGTLGPYIGKKLSSAPAKVKKSMKRGFLVGTDEKFTAYQVKRLGRGRQVRYKDLEFEGTLRRGIVVIVESTTRVVCAIPNEDLAKIANGQEDQIGRIQNLGKARIFALSEEERKLMKDNILEALKQLYARVFNT